MRQLRKKKNIVPLCLVVTCLALVTGGCEPTPTSGEAPTQTPTGVPARTPTGTPTATPTGVPAATPTEALSSPPAAAPTPTPTPAPAADGALTAEESRRLYESSLQYIALTHKEATAVARGLRFLVDEGHPSNMCGPLALAILRDADLVDRSIILHDFWLLNPVEPSDVRLLEGTFPRHRYLWYNASASVAAFDFDAFPLRAGDLLYLLAGPEGTFDHVLVVTRVDEGGRAFSVTNVKTAEGFIIDEVMLYDPHQPGAGQFHEWTDPGNIRLGLTGLGGFRLWRRVEPLRAESSEASDRLGAEVDGLLAGRGGHWNVAIGRAGGDLVYHRGAEEVLSSASAVEVPTALLLFHVLDRQGVGDYDAYLDANGLHGRTFRQLLEAMLVHGDPAATHHLTAWVDEQLDAAAVLQDWGLHQTTLVPNRSTARDVATILEGLYGGRVGTAGARALVLGYLRAGGLDEVFGGGVLQTYAGGAPVLSREPPGVGEVRRLTVVETGGEAYVVVIWGSPPRYGEEEASVEDLERTAGEIVLVFVDEYLGSIRKM